MKKFKFPKTQKLKSEKSINELFEKGHSLSLPPLRVLWKLNSDTSSSLPKATFSASKKNFKRAVDRNLLKRRLREAYRLNKEILLMNSSKPPAGLEIMFLYTSHEIQPYHNIESSLIALLKLLNGKIKKAKS